MSNDAFKVPGKAPTCIGAGFAALDVVLNGDDAADLLAFAGGSCCNIVTILSYLGWASQIIARIGNDEPGDLLVRDIRSWNVGIGGLCVDGAVGTPIVIERLLRDRDGRTRHRFEWRCPCCDRWLPRYQPITLSQADKRVGALPAPGVFIMDRTSPAIRRLAKRFRDAGALVVFEPVSVGELGHFRECTRLAHVVKYSHERLGQARDAMKGMRPWLEIETFGPDGLRYRRHRKGDSGRWQQLDAFPVGEVTDVVGSGDWCTAGLLHSAAREGCEAFRMASDAVMRQSLLFGQALASVNCRYVGARGAMYKLSIRALQNEVNGLLGASRRVKEVTPEPASIGNVPLRLICPDCSKRRRRPKG